MQAITLCTSYGWSGVNHVPSSPMWCFTLDLWLNSVDNINVCNFPPLHPTFPTEGRLEMVKKLGAHTAGTADSCWMKWYNTPYNVMFRNKNGQRNKDRGVSAKVALLKKLAGYQSAWGGECLPLHHLFFFSLSFTVNLFLSQLKFCHDYSSCFVPHPTGVVAIEWAAVLVLS